MSTYTPNRWVVIEMTHGDDVINKVFGGWYGGYTGADSWKLSSGITETKEYADYYEFTNVSGSVYVCHKEAEGFSGYMFDIYSGWERDMEKDTSGVALGLKLIDYGDEVEAK